MPLGFAKIGLIGGLAEAPYLGTNVSADLLFHIKIIYWLMIILIT